MAKSVSHPYQPSPEYWVDAGYDINFATNFSLFITCTMIKLNTFLPDIN